MSGQVPALGAPAMAALAYPIPGEGRAPNVSSDPAAFKSAPLGPYLYNNRVYNVRDYGAVGDGVTNDTAAVQAALNAAAARSQGGRTGGGTVYVPPGSYAVSNLTIGDAVQLIGADRFYSYFIQIGASVGPMLKASAPNQLMRVAHLCFDGNKAGQAAANDLLEFDGTGAFGTYDMQAVVEHCTLINAKGRAIWTHGSNSRGCRFLDTFINACDGNGVELAGFDSIIAHCNIGSSGLAGVLLSGTNNTVTDTQCYGSGRITAASGDGVRAMADRGKILGCTLQDNANSGAKVSGCSNTLITGCLSDSNATAGFDLQSAVNVAVSGCMTVDRAGGSFAHQYGLFANGTTSGFCTVNLAAGSIARLNGVATLTVCLWENAGNPTQLSLATGSGLFIGGVGVVASRVTGWGAGTNGSRAALNASTATLAQTAAAVAQLMADLTTHGLIGP